MSDHVVRTWNDFAGTAEQSMQPYQSAWIAHWTRRGYDAAVQNHNQSLNRFAKKINDYDTEESQRKLEIASSMSSPAKGLKMVETGTFKETNDSSRMTSTTVRNENPGFQSFPAESPRQQGWSSSALKDSKSIFDVEASRNQISRSLDYDAQRMPITRSYIASDFLRSPDANNASSRACHSESEDLLQNTKEPVKTLALFGDSNFAMLRPWRKDFTASASHDVRSGFGNKNNSITFFPSPMGSPDFTSYSQLPHTNLRLSEGENFECQRHSTFLACDEKSGMRSKSFQQNKAPFLEADPSTSNKHSQAFGGEDIQNFSGIRLFQNQSERPDATKSKKFDYGGNSFPEILPSLHDVETMRICATVDSVVGLHEGHSRFSQTTHSLLITKKTDISLCKENQTFTNLRGSADFNLHMFDDLQNLPSPFRHGQRGVKLRPLGGFRDSKVKENANDINSLSASATAEEKNFEDVKAFGVSVGSKGKKVKHAMVSDFNLKNESSAETDTMDLDDFEENKLLGGVNSFPSNKVIILDSMTPRFALGSAREEVEQEKNAKLNDSNLEVPASAAAEKILDNGEASTSRTQSLDMETLLAHAEQHSQSESDHCLGGSAKPEPSSRWVKRLKSSASDSSAIVTKNSILGEELPHEKNNLSLGRIRRGSMTTSEPTVSRHYGKELMVLDKTTTLKCGESPSTGTMKKCVDSPLSYPWIQRWRHCQATTAQKKPQAVVVCDPQSSKLALDDLEKKQFPSIAAMALMGKAMSGFQPCEFQKRGAFVVWNARGF